MQRIFALCTHSHILFTDCRLQQQITVTKSQLFETSVEVAYNGDFPFEIFTTRTTTKWFEVWVLWLMFSQFGCCTETLCTFTANIRLHTFMATYMYRKDNIPREFLLTNVTCEPRTFIVWLQQMCLELVTPCKTVWTVSTWVRLHTSVNTNMTLQISFHFI